MWKSAHSAICPSSETVNERVSKRERENGASLCKVEELVDFTERDFIYSFSTRIVMVMGGGMAF